MQAEVISSQHFELSVIWQAAHKYEQFIFVPDSTEFLDAGNLVDECFKDDLSVSLSQSPCPFGMYLGKYRADRVKELGIWPVQSKLDAVAFETRWTSEYVRDIEYRTLGDLPHSSTFVERNGRLNMVCENRWLRRYKGSWDGSTMMKEHERIKASRA